MKAAFDFFNRLVVEKWSGEIDVTSSQGHATLLIKEGSLIWAHRPLDRAIERIEKLHWIKLPPSEVLGSIRSWEGIVKEILRLNSDQYPRLTKYLKTDRLELFFRIFFWTNVELNPRTFSFDGPDPVEFGFYSPKRLDILIKEAQHRLKEWPTIQDKMGSSKRVFISRVDIPESQLEELDIVDQSLMQFEGRKTHASAISKFPFSEEEMELLRDCNGRNTVEDLIRKSADGEFLTLRRLLALWKKSAIAPKDAVELSSRKTKFFRFSIVEMGALLWTMAMTLGLLWAYSWCAPQKPIPQSIPASVSQAIEIFHELNGHYPLSLLEIHDIRPLKPEEIQSFVYTLHHPQAYELKLKTP
jgi:hypothetical protein